MTDSRPPKRLPGASFDKITYGVRDLWTRKSLGTTKDTLNVELPSHDVLMVRLDKI